jgi:hypothetical protein
MIIDAMLAVVRPGGSVVLRHARNEAITEKYHQLHQWNFDERDGHFLIWRRPGREVDISEAVRGRADVECLVEHSDYEWIVCILRRV